MRSSLGNWDTRTTTRETILSIPVAASTGLLAAAVYFGASRDFGNFLLALLVVPVLLLVTIISLIVAFGVDRGDRRIKFGTMLLVIAPLAAYTASHLRDRVEFFGWSLSHHEMLRHAYSSDRIIAGWESWGMAGSDNFSYLISDTKNGSSTLAGAERWRTRMGLDCPIADTEKMLSGIYIVTTYNCTFNGVAMPGS